MFRVKIDVTVGSRVPLTNDAVTDLIKSVVDDLDQTVLDPSLSTERVGDFVHLTVAVTVDEGAQLDALTQGIDAIRRAFTNAGVTSPSNVRSRVLPLQAA